MNDIAVHAIFRGQRVTIDGDSPTAPTVVPAEHLTFEISSQDEIPQAVLLDKRPLTLALTPDHKRGHFQLDAFRSVGFHCIDIGDSRLYFATDDAKLKLDGILNLLHYVGEAGLSWGQQIYFAGGSVLRDRRVDYAWLLEFGPSIIQVARDIAARPIRRPATYQQVTLPRSGRINIRRTLGLIRQRGLLRTLEASPVGQLAVSGNRYSPTQVVMTATRKSVDTVSNQRVKLLLSGAHSLAVDLSRSREIPKDARTAIEPIARLLAESLDLYPFVALNASSVLQEDPTPEELADERYVKSYSLYETLRRELGWEAGTTVTEQYAFVGYSDQIYQAFVAGVFAKALGAHPVRTSLQPGLTKPSFRSDRYDIYYDTSPPKPEFRNWRDTSGRPSDMRPDLSFVDRLRKTGLLLDAKYRVEGGRAPANAIAECQIYMQSFQQNSIAVCYPGPSPRIEQVTSGAFNILEISISPSDNLLDFVKNDVLPKLLALFQPVLS